MLDVLPCPCKDFPYRANPFSRGMQHLASVRISPTEPTIFHVGCSTLPLQGFPLQIQPFFMLDVVPCLYKDFHYRANPFSWWMQYLAYARISTTEQTLFMMDSLPCLCKDFHYRASPFSCWMQYLASVRIYTTEPALFHGGCSTLPLQGFPLQSHPFSCWM